MKTKHIAVLMGGLSSERDVSLKSGASIVETLTAAGYRVTAVDVGRDIAQRLIQLQPDIALNALHGTYGEDGCIQGVLEFLNIPYTHSGVRASAIGMNKSITKTLVALHNVRSPKGKEFTREALIEAAQQGDPMPRPFVVKPVAEGSSMGVIIVQKQSNIELSAETLMETPSFLLEEYIPGRELSAAVWDKGPLGVVELRPQTGFYDYTNKYTSGKTDHLLPAPVPPHIYQRAMEMAYTAHQVLGCEGVTRSDIRYNDQGDGELYFLEINTHPGMTSLSIVPEIAAHAGISFLELLEYLLQTARCGK